MGEAEEKELERVIVLAENSESMDAIRLAAEVRSLRRRLEAVSAVVSDAAAYGEDLDAGKVLEAVRGERGHRVRFIGFADIQDGDMLRVSFPPRGGMSDNWEITHSRTAIVYACDGVSWFTYDGQVMIDRKLHWNAKIELLSRLEREP